MATTTTPLLVIWDESWLIGVREIDAQHQNLVRMLNQLHQEMCHGKGKEVLGTILASLIRYTQEHFATEERLMLESKYPDIAAHKLQHRQLTEKVLAFEKSFKAGGLASIELVEFLREWLRGHIRGSDAKYVPFVHSRGVR